MSTKIPVSSLPEDLRKLVERDAKRRAGMSEEEIQREELFGRLDELKEAGTLPSGTLTNEEKMEYTKRDSDKMRDRALAEMAEENALSQSSDNTEYLKASYPLNNLTQENNYPVESLISFTFFLIIAAIVCIATKKCKRKKNI